MNFKFNEKYIQLFICVSLVLLSCIGVSSKGVDNNDLYPIWGQDKYLSFIDETGALVVKFQSKEFDYVGNFSEGKVFLVKKIKNYKRNGIYDYILAELYIMDNKGKIIKKIPYKAVIGLNEDLGEDDIPEYYDNKAIINLRNNRSVIINSYGEVIKKGKNIKLNRQNVNIDYIESNKKRIDNMGGLSPSYKYKMDRDGPFPYHVNKGVDSCNCSLGCINYVDKNGKTVIKLNTCYPGGSADYTRDPYFYNGIAMVFGDIPDPTRRFINKKGEYTNNETYLIAVPFWKKLAGVVRLDDSQGYINSEGTFLRMNNKE